MNAIAIVIEAHPVVVLAVLTAMIVAAGYLGWARE
jgi:hypothetical protein